MTMPVACPTDVGQNLLGNLASMLMEKREVLTIYTSNSLHSHIGTHLRRVPYVFQTVYTTVNFHTCK